MNKIEQIITEIEEYVDNCKFQGFSSTKIVVVKEELEELLSELRMSTPDEIKKYQKIVANTDAIMDEAKRKADALIIKANEMTEELVSEHEIMQQAYSQANEVIEKANAQANSILDNATLEANEIRMSAMSYTDSILYEVERILTYSVENLDTKYINLKNSLIENLDVVLANRRELNNSVEQEDKQPECLTDNDQEELTINAYEE